MNNKLTHFPLEIMHFGVVNENDLFHLFLPLHMLKVAVVNSNTNHTDKLRCVEQESVTTKSKAVSCNNNSRLSN
jgi:hypothetical protein